MRISDWSSDVCSSDLRQHLTGHVRGMFGEEETQRRIECIVGTVRHLDQIRGRAVLADFLAERADETTQSGGGGPGVDVVKRFRFARYQQPTGRASGGERVWK